MSSLRSRGVRFLLGLAGLAVLVGVLFAAGAYWGIMRDLPELRTLADYHPPLTTRVLDRKGRPIGEFFEHRRRLATMDEIPEHLVSAFVAAEDDGFFEHAGLDYVAILRAAWVDLLAGEKKQGASTITMQTAKNLLLTPERRFTRKIKEMILARRIEERFSKLEILFLYLNEIYFGSGAYGVAEAARTYFDADVGDLTASEAALLAGLPKAPSKYSPFRNPAAAERRRRYVLERMRDAGFVDAAAYEDLVADRPEVRRPVEYDDFSVAGYFTEEVRRVLFEALGAEEVLRGGLTVHTTLDRDLQRAAVESLRAGLVAYDQRQGFRGPLRRVAPEAVAEETQRVAEENGLPVAEEDAAAPSFPFANGEPSLGVVTDVDAEAGLAFVAFGPDLLATVRLEDVAWARPVDPKTLPKPVERIDAIFRAGDVARFVPAAAPERTAEGETFVTLLQEPDVEGALLALDVASSEVLALVGGYDFERSEFDRALQARRQPGSAFKPLIYATALEAGYTAATIVHDRPMVYTDEESGFTWRPENYGRRFLGPLTLREALARSVNNATIHLLRDVGVGNLIDLARRLGIESPLEGNLSLALGASPISLFELTRAYAAFPAGGERVVPTFVTRVEDRDGDLVLEHLALSPSDRKPLGEDEELPVEVEELFVATQEPLEGSSRALDRTTAYLAVQLLRAVVEEPRGTGRRARSLGRTVAGKTGTTNDQGDAWFMGFSPDVVAGVWVGYDEKRLLGRGETGGRAALPIWLDFMRAAHAERPVSDFEEPAGIVVARIDRATGLLADSSSQDFFFQAFAEGTEPTETAASLRRSREGARRLRLEF